MSPSPCGCSGSLSFGALRVLQAFAPSGTALASLLPLTDALAAAALPRCGCGQAATGGPVKSSVFLQPKATMRFGLESFLPKLVDLGAVCASAAVPDAAVSASPAVPDVPELVLQGS